MNRWIRWTTHLRVGAWLLLVTSLCGAVAAEDPMPEPRDGDTVQDYVVQAGDSLQGLTAKYLGSSEFWRDNWRLNPGLANPDMLVPGQAIRIIVDRRLPELTAVVRKIRRRVEAKTEPVDWAPAQEGIELGQSDGLRTFRGASAELRFNDGAEFLLSEDSLIVLRQVTTTPRGVGRETIELVSGQAELVARAGGRSAADIELILGGVIARPQPDGTGSASSRVRVTEAGDSHVMMFGGRAQVEAAGTEVAVHRGMGTAVPEGAPPLPPERLLPAPRHSRPAPREEFLWANPLLSWSAVPGASRYFLDICTTASCEEISERIHGIDEPSYRPPWLSRGVWYWRVTAVSETGLDGYTGTTRPVVIVGPYPDREPPIVLVSRRATSNEALGGARERVVSDAVGLAITSVHSPGLPTIEVRKGSRLILQAHDDMSRVQSLSYRWDDGRWTDLKGVDSVDITARSGAILEVKAQDRAERVSPVWRARVVDWTGASALPDVRIDLNP